MKSRKINKKFIKKRRIIKKGGQANTIAYVINLPERTDRKEKIIESFKNSSINLEFINAVKVKEGENGNIGIMETYKNIIRSHKNEPFILIFEDDCKPFDNFDKRWNIAKKWLNDNPNEWEIFGGGVYPTEQVELKYKLDEDVNLFTSGQAYFAQWTYINSSAYEKILEYNFYIHGTTEQYIYNTKYFKYMTIYPILAFQESGKSNIERRNIPHLYNYGDMFKSALGIKGGSRSKSRRYTQFKGG